jgi:serine/threonine-protein kinase
VLRALAKDPGERFQTAAEFAAALRAAPAAATCGDAEPVAAAREDTGPGAEDAAGAAAGAVVPASAPVVPAPTAVVAAPATDAAGTVLVPGSGGATAATALAGPSPAPPPARRRSRWWIAAAAVVLTAAAAALGYWLFSLAAGPAVPKVVGSFETAARGAIQGEGLRVVTHREYVDGVPAGYVSRQKPRPGVELTEGARVEIWVSRGPVTLPAPDVRGLSAGAAEERLEDADLVAERRNGRSEDVATGDVFRQEPKAGELVGRGETVVYWVSTGLPLVAVPDVVGYSSGDAAALLEEAGLTASVDLSFGWGEYPYTVVDQEPAAGTKLEQGAEVVIRVAVF